MPAVLPLHSLNAAASDAASSRNFPAAAALLRQVLELQTTMLGPDHADLAPTLNNLGLMLERSGDTAEAGRCYRRALAVATLAHGRDAPSVRVSQANLAAFYREFGADDNHDPNVSPGGLDDFAPTAPLHAPDASAAPAPAMTADPEPLAEELLTRQPAPLPAALPPTRLPATRPWRNPEAVVAIASEPEVRLPIFAARRPPAPLPAQAMRPLFVPQEAPTWPWRRTAGGMLVLALGLVLAGVPAWWLRGSSPVGSQPEAAVVARGIGTSGNTPEEGPIAEGEAAEAAVTEDGSEPVTAPATADETHTAWPSTPDVAPSSPTLRVAEAGLCAVLSTGSEPWSCEPTRDTVRGGSVYYYTRVASPRDELIRHRWTRDGQLVQMVILRILTNSDEGYRTFSRQSGPLLEAGTWQVALLAPDGRVLDETEFIVR